MGFGSPIHWIVVIALVVLLFGSGRVSTLMGDVAKGIKSFKKGMADDDEAAPAPPPRRISDERVIEATPPVAPSPEAQPVERGTGSDADRH
jgi:sec-independent protein translocase protein TatA